MPKWPLLGHAGALAALLKGASASFPSRQFPVSVLNLCLPTLLPECPVQRPEATCLQLLLGFPPAWFGHWVGYRAQDEACQITLLLLPEHFKGQSTLTQSPTVHLSELAEKQALHAIFAKK